MAGEDIATELNFSPWYHWNLGSFMQSLSGDLQQQDLHPHSDLALKRISSSCWEEWQFCMTVTSFLGKIPLAAHGRRVTQKNNTIAECLGPQARQPPQILSLFIFFSSEYRDNWLYHITSCRGFFCIFPKVTRNHLGRVTERESVCLWGCPLN